MEYNEYLQIGIKSIKQHKMRSFLTMLGVIFGVAAVISMMSIAGGAKKVALEQIKLLGTNNIRVRNVELTDEKKAEAEYRGSFGLNPNDIDLIETIVPGITAVAPLKFIDTEIFYGDKKANGKIVGTNTQYDRVANFYVGQGRFISDLDVAGAKKVCVLGADVAGDLFKFKNPLGETVKIENTWYMVVGIMQDKEVQEGKNSTIRVRNINRDVYVPITTVLSRFLNSDLYDRLDEIAVKVKEQDNVVTVSRIIERVVLRNHLKVKDFELVIPQELLAQAQKTQRIFNIIMGAIAAISLLVGGIGIMNIMLATVTERIREIGIRRAIGATKMDIMLQFLNETVFISISGGIIGIILGSLMAAGITMYAEWDTDISGLAVIIAFGISAMVGIIFGIYPARKAAMMDPIQALRTE